MVREVFRRNPEAVRSLMYRAACGDYDKDMKPETLAKVLAKRAENAVTLSLNAAPETP